MKKLLGIISIAVGIAVIYFSLQAADKKAEAQAMQDAIQSVEDAETALIELRKSIPEIAAACQHVKTQPFFDICELEPYEGQPTPVWTTVVKDADQECIVSAFHITNQHAFQFKDREYSKQTPSDMNVISFACDVSSATLFDDNLSIFDPEGSGTALLESFYRERAGTRWGPEKHY